MTTMLDSEIFDQNGEFRKRYMKRMCASLERMSKWVLDPYKDKSDYAKFGSSVLDPLLELAESEDKKTISVETLRAELGKIPQCPDDSDMKRFCIADCGSQSSTVVEDVNRFRNWSMNNYDPNADKPSMTLDDTEKLLLAARLAPTFDHSSRFTGV